VGREGVGEQAVLDTRFGAQQGAEFVGGGVVAGQAHQQRLAAEAADVSGHVAGRAQHGGFGATAQHRDGRLGRDARDSP
jgi:hypothetical protein